MVVLCRNRDFNQLGPAADCSWSSLAAHFAACKKFSEVANCDVFLTDPCDSRIFSSDSGAFYTGEFDCDSADWLIDCSIGLYGLVHSACMVRTCRCDMDFGGVAVRAVACSAVDTACEGSFSDTHADRTCSTSGGDADWIDAARKYIARIGFALSRHLLAADVDESATFWSPA